MQAGLCQGRRPGAGRGRVAVLQRAQRPAGAVHVRPRPHPFYAEAHARAIRSKSFLEGVGLDGLNRMLAGFDDKTAYALCTYAYLESASSEPILFEGKTHGSIVPARGSNGFGWDPIFEVAVGDQRLTCARMLGCLIGASSRVLPNRQLCRDGRRHQEQDLAPLPRPRTSQKALCASARGALAYSCARV